MKKEIVYQVIFSIKIDNKKKHLGFFVKAKNSGDAYIKARIQLEDRYKVTGSPNFFVQNLEKYEIIPTDL